MRFVVFAFFAFVLAIGAIGSLGQGSAWAQQEGGGKTAPPAAKGRHKEPTATLFFNTRLARAGLNKEQKEKIRAIFVAHEKALAETSSRYVDKRRQLRMLIEDPDIAEEAIKGLAEEIGQIEAELALERNRVLKEVTGLLTPEQLAKFKKGRSEPYKKESGQSR